MENKRRVSFNILKKNTKCILRRLQERNDVINEVKDLLEGVTEISDEEREHIETVDHLWDTLVQKEVISMDDLQVLKTINNRFLKSKELEKEIESHENESSGTVRRLGLGISKTAKLVIKTGLPLTVGLAVLSYCGENEAAKQTVLEKLVLPPLVNLDEVCEGSVCFVIETSSLSSLQQLWMSYKDGSLTKKFEKIINEIDEVRKLTQGTEIDVTVEIDEDEYREACWVLVLAKSHEFQAQSGKLEKRRRHSFSCDHFLPVADETQLTVNEIENSRDKAQNQIGNLRQEINRLKENIAKKEREVRVTSDKKEAELKIVRKVNDELLKDRYSKATCLSSSLQKLRLVKDACLGMKPDDKDAKKIVFDSIERYQKAMQYFEKCLSTILEGSEGVEISEYGNLGNVFHSLSDYPKAMGCYEKALEIAEKSGNKKEQMNAHRNLGIVQWELDQSEEAIQHHKKQLQLARILGHKMEEGKAYENLGAVYSKVREYETAAKYYKKFLKVAREDKDVMRGNRNLGDVFKQSERYNNAIMYYEESLNNATEKKDKMRMFESLGESYEHLENYKKASQNYAKYLQVSDDMNGKATVCERLGNAYRMLDMNDDALEAFIKSLTIAKEIDDEAIQATVYGSMEEIYKRLGEKKDILNCQNQREKLIRKSKNAKKVSKTRK